MFAHALSHRIRGASIAALAATSFALLANGALAQSQQRWIPFDTTPPGTPAEIKLDGDRSDATISSFDVYIHGFWVTDKVGGDGKTYQVITCPGLPTMNQLGAPDLPVGRVDLGIATGAREVTLGNPTFYDVRKLQGYLPWPQPYEEEDHAGGTKERFARDETIYSGRSVFPLTNGGSSSVLNMLGCLPYSASTVYPFKWDPTIGELQVATHVAYSFRHSGTPTRQLEMTKHRGSIASKLLFNWSEVSAYFPINLTSYQGEFLFIHPIAYMEECMPLFNQKKARGFHVTAKFTEQTGTTCNAIRAAIQSWYASTPCNVDHYCLLVGDVNTIPLCTAPTGDPTDDLYGSTNGNDLDEEVYIGRLSVDSEADCTQQITRIMNYEDHPVLTYPYGDVLLIANKEDAPGKYEGCQEAVRTFPYSQVTPNFYTLYGSVPGNDNADLSAYVNAGMGLVCYRGHGDWNEWWNWDQTSQNYTNTEVDALTNAPMDPVVWSIACTTADLNSSDCFGEHWMEQNTDGAVSFYGATVPSGTQANHVIDQQLFQAVYDKGLTTQSHAIEYAEHQCSITEGDDNPWMYLLLGDPQMQIRRTNLLKSSPWVVVKPDWIQVGCEAVDCCPGCPGPPIDIRILTEAGLPVVGVKVAVWKQGAQGLAPRGDHGLNATGDELLDNRYTDANGWAHIPASPLSKGEIYFTVEDDNANALSDSIPVSAGPTGVAAGGKSGASRLQATPSVTQSWTHLAFGRALDHPAQVTVFSLTGQAVRTLDVASGERGVVWDGKDGAGHRVSTGVYLARLQDGASTQSARIVVTR
jgi:hypothetical protein